MCDASGNAFFIIMETNYASSPPPKLAMQKRGTFKYKCMNIL